MYFHNVIYMNIQKQTAESQQLANNQIKIEPEELDSLRLSDVFQQAKYLINIQSKGTLLGEKNEYNKRRLRVILEFVIRKLKSKEMMEIKKFLGLISLFSFLLTAAQNQQNSLIFPINFYRNLHKYSHSVIEYWADPKEGHREADKRKILLTFLFALTTFCENSHKFPGLDIKKILSLGLVKSLLKLKLNDDERLLRHYRILMLHIYEHKHQNLPSLLLLSSLSYHLIACSSNSNTQYAIVFLLNKFLKNKKISIEFAHNNDLMKVAAKLKSIIFREDLSSQMRRLVFSLLSKIIQLDIRVSKGLLTVDNLIQLIVKLESGTHSSFRSNFTIFTILGTFSPQESFQVYKYFVKLDSRLSASLELLEFLTRKLSPDLLVDMIETGLISHLLSQSQKTQEGPPQTRNLVNCILNNVLQGSRGISSQISQILRRLYIMRGNELLIQNEEFSFY